MRHNNGKTAVVTGGASGIGKAVVLKLSAEGYDTAIVYNRSEAEAYALASGLLSLGARAAAFRCDVSDSEEVNITVKKIADALGSPEILVNNAGISQQKLFTDITDGDWNAMIGVNLTGTFNMCRAVLPYMIHKKSGSIVNISSMWGQTGGSCEVHYSAAKAGVIGLTKALAKEVSLSGIRVNCIAPGVVGTKMMSSFSEDDIDALCGEIPLGRMGTPEEIAEAAAFLASDKASYITGQILGVNGGAVI